MKIVIAGGSGQIGTFLAREFHSRGDEVVILSRQSSGVVPWKVANWDAEQVGDWAELLEGSDLVLNLAGRNVSCRYNDENRRQIIESRTRSTSAVGAAIAKCKVAPRVWLQSSTATIYAHRFDAPNDEDTGIIGGSESDAPSKWRFSIEVAQAWENTFERAHVPNTRKVALRSAIVLSPDRGGIFDVLLRLVRFGLGGQSGSGKQYVSWIHDRDFAAAIDWIVNHDTICGIVNLSSPFPVTNAELMSTLRNSWGIGFGLPATDWMLELGAVFLNTETELVLKSRRVIPGRLLLSGFNFRFAKWDDASNDLCQRWRQGSHGR